MHASIIDQLGFQFDKALNVQGRLSISDYFPKSKPRCGIYLLGFSNDTYYIGQAIDAVRRFAQHRKNYADIISYWFQPIEKSQLDTVEQKLIYAAEKQGLLLTNRTFVSNIIGDTDLDLIIPPHEQTAWLNNSDITPKIPNNLYGTVADKFIIKYQQKFRALTLLPEYLQIKKLIAIYIAFCLPVPASTQLSFWSLSCLPSNSSQFARHFCLNINAMEVFVAGTEKKTGAEFGFLVASVSILGNYIKILRRKYLSLDTYDNKYRAAGADQITLDFSDMDELYSCLRNEPLVRQAIKHLNLRLMRKGGTIYSPYHCFDLANVILSQ